MRHEDAAEDPDDDAGEPGGTVKIAAVTGRVPYIDPEKLARARAFRRDPTPAARRTWELLRGRRTLGLKFRREQIIDGFFADFYCPAIGLVVEIDGDVHDEPDQADYDAIRSQWFAALGIRVARIRNEAVTKENLERLITPFMTSASVDGRAPRGETSPPNPLSIDGEGASERVPSGIGTPPSPSMERGAGGVRSEAQRAGGVRSEEKRGRPTVEGEVPPVGRTPGKGEVEDIVLRARRLVAQRCLYGVDKNPLAVSLARLSLWLVTLAKDEPFTFVDHALRHGDSLVGLDLEQIRSFHWKPGAQLEFARELIDTALREALEARQRILALAPGDDVRAKEHLLWDANDALAPVRLIGDLVVGAFFAHEKDKAREAERKRRLDLVVKWLESREAPTSELLEMQRALRERVPAFHWWVEFPEVFYGERPDPLDGWRSSLPLTSPRASAPPLSIDGEGLPSRHQVDRHLSANEAPSPSMERGRTAVRGEVGGGESSLSLNGGRVNRVAWMDAFVGNPPFAGKNAIAEANAEGYLDWLMAMHPEVEGHPNIDLCGYFFRRAATLLGSNGSLGLIATNTIAQGDTRLFALKHLMAEGAVIFDATPDMTWPGQAAVSVSVVHIAKGEVGASVAWARLNGHRVRMLDSRLRAGMERPEAVSLKSNTNLSFMGGKLVGEGLAVGRDEYAQLIARDARNAEILRPYLGGEDLNQNPPGPPSRYAVNFTEKSLDEARAWPDLLAIAEERVRPDREKNKRQTYRTYWWKPGESGGALYTALAGMDRCLVSANVTKHLSFSFQPTKIFFSQTLYVFPLAQYSAFAVLQSRVHGPWARRLSSSLEDRLRYAASDCFETFPFPQTEPRAVIPTLEEVGERLYTTRAKYMIDTQQGLTQTYNQLKDPRVREARVVELRRLHEEMDRAVLAAYGWEDVKVPPYGTPVSDAEKKALERFEDEVIDRLFALNAKRAEEERQAAEREAATKEKPAKGKGGRKKKGDAGEGQGTLGIG